MAQDDKPAMIKQIGTDFVMKYNSQFDSDRSGLARFYLDNSCMMWEGNETRGGKAIMEKLVGLPFQRIQHANVNDAMERVSVDVQDLGGEHILLMTNGMLMIDDEVSVKTYSQTFVVKYALSPDGSHQYGVVNEIFRLTYPAA